MDSRPPPQENGVNDHVSSEAGGADTVTERLPDETEGGVSAADSLNELERDGDDADEAEADAETNQAEPETTVAAAAAAAEEEEEEDEEEE